MPWPKQAPRDVNDVLVLRLGDDGLLQEHAYFFLKRAAVRSRSPLQLAVQCRVNIAYQQAGHVCFLSLLASASISVANEATVRS